MPAADALCLSVGHAALLSRILSEPVDKAVCLRLIGTRRMTMMANEQSLSLLIDEGDRTWCPTRQSKEPYTRRGPKAFAVTTVPSS